MLVNNPKPVQVTAQGFGLGDKLIFFRAFQPRNSGLIEGDSAFILIGIQDSPRKMRRNKTSMPKLCRNKQSLRLPPSLLNTAPRSSQIGHTHSSPHVATGLCTYHVPNGIRRCSKSRLLPQSLL